MNSTRLLPRKCDSKTISLLSILLAMVIALEIFPIVGITDIPVPGFNFTLDWTGVPLVLIFLFFGPALSLVGIGVMGLAIGYRNPIGAVFKVLAELFKIIGLSIAWFAMRDKDMMTKKEVLYYTIAAAASCAIGMFIANILLLQILYGLALEAATLVSAVLVPWNVIQSVINVVGGSFLFQLIPRELRAIFSFTEETYNQLEHLSD